MTGEAWINTVRLARDLGTVAQLLPDGIHDLTDLPYPIFDAIHTALQILGYEEWPLEDRPPRQIWLDAEKLTDWFDMVRARREAKMKGEDRSDEIEDPVQNELTRGLREKLRSGR